MFLLVVAAAIPAAAQKRQHLEVGSLTLVGVESIDEGRLRDVLATRESSWLPWSDPVIFDRDAFERDLDRIVAFYRDHGFPDARVISHDIEVRPEDNKVDLTIRVEEGEPLIVAEMDFDGFDMVSGLEEFRKTLPVREGEPVVHRDVLTAGEMAVNLLRDHGYPEARVSLAEDRLHDRAVRIRYQALPGPPAVFGPIQIAGNTSVSDAVIRRELAYRPGESFRRSVVVESQRRLFNLELFDFVNIEALPVGEAGAEPGTVPTRVTVVEGDHRKILFSGGYGTEEKFRVEGTWRHVNFYGGARVLNARAKWSSLDQGLEADILQPHVFGTNVALSLEGHGWYADELAYTALSRGARMTATSRIGRRLTLALSYLHDYQRSEISNEALLDFESRDELISLGLDPTTGVQEGTLAELIGSIEYNATVNPLDPSSGYLMSLSLERAGGLLPGTFHFYAVSAEARHYLPLGPYLTWANRARIATTDPDGPRSDVPFAKRYFLGGSTSLRGWGRFEVAPLSGFGLPIGGFSALELSTEARVGTWRNIGLVFFLDAGNVWPGSWEFGLGDLVYDAGPGLRYQTPVGPVRADLAWQLTPIEGLRIDGAPQRRAWRLHFAIGASF